MPTSVRSCVPPCATAFSLVLCLLGTAASPAFADDFLVSPTDLNFGGIFVGDDASIGVVITNVSGIPQTPAFAGGGPRDSDNFGGAQSCAGITLAPGAHCQFTYHFHPTSPGPKSTTTSIGINNVSYVITMSGMGLFPIASSDLDLDFGNVDVGDSVTISITFINLSGVPQQPSFAGGGPNDSNNFSGSQGCAGITLQPGAACTFNYTFHPISSGPKHSSTTIGVDSRTFPVTLAGNGAGDGIFHDGFD